MIAIFSLFLIPIVHATGFSLEWYSRSSVVPATPAALTPLISYGVTTSVNGIALYYMDQGNTPQNLVNNGTMPAVMLGKLEYFMIKARASCTLPAGTFTIVSYCDDGCSLKVNGAELYPTAFKLQSRTRYAATFVSPGGTPALFEGLFYEQTGQASWEVKLAGGPQNLAETNLDFRWCSSLAVNSIPWDGFNYATLDDASLYLTSPVTCQDRNRTAGIPLPLGWTIAPDSVESRAVAYRFSAGTQCLIVANGNSLLAGWGGSESDQYCTRGGDALETTVLTNGTTLYRPRGAATGTCTSRILIVSPGNAASGDVALGQNLATNMRSISFDGEQFGVLTGLAPSSTIPEACSSRAILRVPEGWAISPDDSKVRAALPGASNTFSASCFVLASGVAISATQGGSCTGASGTDNLITVFGKYYRPRVCGHQIVIRRSTASGALGVVTSWTSAPTITQITNVRSTTEFAVMTNAAASDRTSTQCQGQARAVPSGWTIATSTTPQLAALLSAATYGVSCLALADGSGVATGKSTLTPCGSSLIASQVHGGRTFVAATACPVAVLLSRTVAVAALNPASTCGTCTAWGDPHYTSFDGVKFNFFGVGEFWVVKPVTGSAKEDNWFIRSFNEKVGPSGAAKHSVIAVNYETDTIIVSVDKTAKRAISPTVTINGVPRAFAAGESLALTAAGHTVSRAAGSGAITYTVTLPNGTVVTIKAGFWNLNLLDLTVRLTNQFRGKTVGLCGSCDGDQSNDFKKPDCAVIPTRTQFDAYAFGMAWQVGAPLGTCGAGAPPATTPSAPVINDRGELDKEGTEIKQNDPPVDHCAKAAAAVRRAALAACGSIVDAILKDHCLIDVCVTGDPTIATLTEDVATKVTEEIVPAPPACATSTITQTTKSFYGNVYALLDNASPSSTEAGCQTTPLAVPAGWRIAEDSPVHRAALACNTWGATCVVFANGQAYGRDLTPCGGDNLITSVKADQRCHTVARCSRRILIVKNPSTVVSADAGLFKAAPAGSPTLVAGWEDLESFSSKGATVSFPYTIDAKVASMPPTAAARDGAASAIVITAPAATTLPNTGVVYQALYTPGSAMRSSFTIRAWSRAEAVAAPSDPSDYSLYVDVFFHDGSSVQGRHFAPFRAGTHDWESASVDVDIEALANARGATVSVSQILVYLLFRNAQGKVWFADVSVTGISGAQSNLLRQGTVDVGATEEWLPLGEGYTVDTTEPGNVVSGTNSGGKPGSIRLSRTSSTAGTTGAYQGLDLTNKPSPSADYTALYVGAWSKATGLDPTWTTQGSYYSLYWDAQYADGTNEFGNFESFAVKDGASDWQYVDRVWKPAKAVAKVTLNTILRNQPGTAHFDGLFALWTCPAGARSTPANGFSHGDPHIVSLDGGKYDVHRIGEFVLFSDMAAMVQVRHSVAGKASVNSAFHLSVSTADGLDTVQVDRGMGKSAPKLRIGGAEVSYESPSTLVVSPYTVVTVSGSLQAGSISFRIASTLPQYSISGLDTPADLAYVFEFTAHATTEGVQYLQVFLDLPEQSKGRSLGLMGNYNGDKADDWTMSDGSTVTTDVDAFADSWRVDELSSRFVHVNGETADTLFNPNFKPAVLTAFTEAQQNTARQACADAGLSADFLDDCALDYLAHSESYTKTGYQRVAASGKADLSASERAVVKNVVTTSSALVMRPELVTVALVIIAALFA